MKTDNLFGGFTNADGTRTHDAPSFWPFGTIGPVSEYSFRYAPDSAVYEKQPRVRKVVEVAVEAEDLPPGVFAFAALVSTLSISGDKA